MTMLLPANEEEYSVESREASPAHLLTKIYHFSGLSKNEIKTLESKRFEAGGYKWKVRMNVDDGDGHISVYLCVVETNSLAAGWEVNAIFNFFLYNHISDKYLCFGGKAMRFHATNLERGFPKLMTKKSLMEPSNGYILDDRCVFGAEVFVIKKQPLIEKVSMLNLSNPYKQKLKISPFWRPNIGGARRCGRYASNLFKWIHSKTIANKAPEYSVETRATSPTHLLTTIESFSLLSKHRIPIYESTEFQAGDYKWKMRMNLDDGDGHICVDLCMVGTSALPAGWEVNVIFNFFLYNHISDTYTCFRGKAWRFHGIKLEWVLSKLMKKKRLVEAGNGYVFKDKCVFGGEVVVVKKPPLMEIVRPLRLSDPYKRIWKISGFSKLGSRWDSGDFDYGGYKWSITMYPKGETKESHDYVSIFVNLKSSDGGKSLCAECIFCFRNVFNEKENHTHKVPPYWFTPNNLGWGFPNFKAIGEMHDPTKGFLVHDCCILEIELSLLATSTTTTSLL